MTNSETLLAALLAGDHEDRTVAAALDALREDQGLDLLRAVELVAKTWQDGCTAREIARAASWLKPGSGVRRPLLNLIVTECPSANEDSPAAVTVVAGDSWPELSSRVLTFDWRNHPVQGITVGARWVLERVGIIRQEKAQSRRLRRRLTGN